MQCAFAYVEADIRAECHRQYVPPDTRSVRVVTCRTAELGFLAARRPDADVVDVSTVSPYELGAAVADDVALTRPGRHARIVVSQCAPPRRAEFDEGFTVRHRASWSAEIVIVASEVSVCATVQSPWRPTRRWGVDRGRRVLVWVRVHDGGEYIYA
jgi:hypothetical protein